MKLLLNKKQVRQKRIGLLIQEEDISKICSSCVLKINHNIAAVTEGKSKWNLINCEESECKYYSDLRAIGRELENLSQQKKEAQMIISLTVERYTELKSKGKTDKQIMKEFGYHNQAFNDWKHDNGLIKQRTETNKEVSRIKELYSKPQTALTEADLKKIFDELYRLEKFEKDSKAENEKLLAENLQYEQAIMELEQSAEHMRLSLEETVSEVETLKLEMKGISDNNIIRDGYDRSQKLTLLLMQEVIALREERI